MADAGCSWDLAFNTRLDTSDFSLPTWAVQPLAAPREDVTSFSAILAGCSSALERQLAPLKDELVLLKRLLHRNKSQHRNSIHLRRLRQLRVSCERLDSSGLRQLLDGAQAATHVDCEGGSIRGNTLPSRQLVDLLLARLVTAGVLAHRAHRAASLAFGASEELICHALFMPLAVTCLALSARFHHVTAQYLEVLAESHFRLSAMRGRAPLNPAASAHVPAAAALSAMPGGAAHAPQGGTAPPDFAAEVKCLQRALGDELEEDVGCGESPGLATSGARAAAAAGGGGCQQRDGLPAAGADAKGVRTSEMAEEGGGGGERHTRPVGGGDSAKEEEDEGVGVEDLGVLLHGGTAEGLPRNREKDSSRREPAAAGPSSVSAAAATADRLKSDVVERESKSGGRGAGEEGGAVAGGSAAFLEGKKKKKKKKAALAEGRVNLGGSGAAALAALADAMGGGGAPEGGSGWDGKGKKLKGEVGGSKAVGTSREGGAGAASRGDGALKMKRKLGDVGGVASGGGARARSVDDAGASKKQKLKQASSSTLSPDGGVPKAKGGPVSGDGASLGKGKGDKKGKTGGKVGIFSDLLPSGSSWGD